MKKTLHKLFQWLYAFSGLLGFSREITVIVLIALITGSLWIFLEITDEVLEGEARVFDRTLLLALRNPSDRNDPLGPPWVEELGRDFTALGGVGVSIFFTLAAIGFLLLKREKKMAIFVTFAIVGAFLFSMLLKSVFDRPRPAMVSHRSQVYTASFPSGHSMMSVVIYFTLGVLLARSQAKRRMKLYILGCAIIISFLIGISRVYLGVHWPTDVLAGWSLGAAWAMLCWLLARRMQRAGMLERPTEEETI